MEVRYRVNLDFDAALAANHANYKNEKFLKELEYIFFLVNKEPSDILCTSNTYSVDYLNSLNDLGFIIPNLSQSFKDCNNWWGDLSNFELSKKLNSKCWLASWHKPLQDKVIYKEEDIELVFPSYYRSDQGFSGINNKVINNIGDTKNLRLPGVQSRLVDVIQTFGVTYSLKNNEFFIVENIIDSDGKFNGGKLIELSDLKVCFEIEPIIALLRNNIEDKSVDLIQFDNMIYKDADNTYHLCPLVEINYRRTMGTVIKDVSEVLGKGTLYFGTKKFLSSDSIILSPVNVRNICYFNRA